jgi:CheY-like chemotaxis protein
MAAAADRPLAACPEARAEDAPTVLIADADPVSRDRHRQAAIRLGLRVCEAADGRDALAQLFSERPQVIVFDEQLPFIDGLQLCALIRGDVATASVFVVAMTHERALERLRSIRDCGADAVFVKPVGAATLASALRRLYAAKRRPSPSTAPRSGVRLTDAPRRAHSGASRTLSAARTRERYITRTPPWLPPHLRCPMCDAPLQYDRSHVGGVNDRRPEQWDYFVCANHGAFQYRHRTRKLRAS